MLIKMISGTIYMSDETSYKWWAKLDDESKPTFSFGCIEATPAEWKKYGAWYLANRLYEVTDRDVDKEDILMALLAEKGREAAHKIFDGLLDKMKTVEVLSPSKRKRVLDMHAAIMRLINAVLPSLQTEAAKRKK